jgi:O-antigen/teichoic acid export membrane protein
MLAMFRSEAEVGYYDMAVKLSTLTTLILMSISSIAGPKFSELFHSGRMDELFYVAKKSTQLVFWTTTPVLFCLLLFGKPLLGHLFGSKFTVAYPSLVLLVIGQFLNSVSGSTGLFMNMTGQQNIFKNIIFGAAAINVSLNFFLIPKFGIMGAAFAAMASVIFWNITTLLYMKMKYGRTTGYFPDILSWLKFLRFRKG